MTKDQSRPDVVVILVDDMGFSDIGCYGGEVKTPNINRLARDGVVFSQAYNCARCCPTRASLLTGMYPHQAGVGHMVKDWGVSPAYQGYLRDDTVTIAEALKAGGYRTYMSGKWHVGGEYAANQPATWRPGEPGKPIPVQRGFDRHYGMVGGGGSYFDPPYMIEDTTIIHEGGDGYYLTDAISRKAAEFIDDAAATDDPFFLYVAYTAPHWPLHALPEDIERYRGKYRGGWDATRTARHEEMKGLGIVDRSWEISPRDPDAPAWADARAKEWEDLRMAVYAAQIDRMDRGIGEILDRLESTGRAENTIVMFLSDNGGCAEFLAEDSSRPEPFRYNIPTSDGRPMRVGNTPEIAPGPDDTFASYDLPWANVSNTPFRLFKHWVHEGGISTPLIVHWPRRGNRGGIVHEPCHVVDIMPTILDAAGLERPNERDGLPVADLEGESFLDALTADPRPRNRPLFWEHEGNRAVRDGAWKLVSKRPGAWELYDMQTDRTELTDLAEHDKDRVKRMAAQYDDWARRVGVLEYPPRR